MRKLLILTAMIIGSCLPTFSQSANQLQVDSTSHKFGIFNNKISLGHHDSIDLKKLLNHPENHLYLPNANSDDKNLHFDLFSDGRIKTQHTGDNMPCLYPQGSYPMPVCTPDSTVRYTLLIKKFQ